MYLKYIIPLFLLSFAKAQADDCRGDGSLEPDCKEWWNDQIGDAAFYLPHEWDCTKFWECYPHGVGKCLKQCAKSSDTTWLFFDFTQPITMGICGWPYDIDCHIPTMPPQTTTTEATTTTATTTTTTSTTTMPATSATNTEPTGSSETSEPTTVSTSATSTTTAPNPDGVLIVGDLSGSPPELWSHESSCLLDAFGNEAKNYLTLNNVNDVVISCLGDRCEKLEGGSWTLLTNTQVNRKDHTSAVLNSEILLIGGGADPSSTEWIPVDGSSAHIGFTINPGRRAHCSIQPSPNIVILTGGIGTGDAVTEVILPDGTPTTNLPTLNFAREFHACGSYEYQGKQTLIVTGGCVSGWGSLMDSTEVYDYSPGISSGAWREAGVLPSARSYFNGITLNDIFHVTGGSSTGSTNTEVLAWDPATEIWGKVGDMQQSRSRHAVTLVRYEDIQQYCAPSAPHFTPVFKSVGQSDIVLN